EPWLRHIDAVHDAVLSLGDLTSEALWARTDRTRVTREALEDWLGQLAATRRVIEVRMGCGARYAAAAGAGRRREPLGVLPPGGVPIAFLDPVADPLGDILSRYARTHTPFSTADAARRFGVGEAVVRETLIRLRDAGRIVEGEFTPGRRGHEWCDAGVLRTIKRRSLARLRKQVEAVPLEAYARFLPAWHGLIRPRRGLDGVLDAIEQLQGAPLVASVLERASLPAR